MKFKRKARRILVAAIRARLTAGESELRIQEELELTQEDYQELVLAMYREDAVNRFEKPVDQAYIDFCLRQEGCIRDLDSLLRSLKGGRNANAAIGAIRAKSDILDRMVTRGQDFGLLKKVPDQHEIIAGIAVKELGDRELREKVVTELETLRAAMVRFGEVDVLDARPIYAKPPLRLKGKTEDGDIKEGTPHFAKGGVSKAAGAHSKVEAGIKRRKQDNPPPK